MLLKITPEHYDEGCYECGGGSLSGIKHEETTVEQLLSEMNEFQLQQLGLIRVSKDADKKLSPLAVSTLKQQGFVHAASVEDRAKRKELEQKFFKLSKRKGSIVYGTYCEVREMDFENLTDNDLRELAAYNTEIMQKVTPKSVLSEADYKKFKVLEKQKAEAAKKKAETAEKKLLTKKQKDIAKAKKILEEAGELNELVEKK